VCLNFFSDSFFFAFDVAVVGNVDMAADFFNNVVEDCDMCD
jgi:hypothetical protein